ncbi:MAG: replicative DNA helicase, partial [Sarcina sp.]
VTLSNYLHEKNLLKVIGGITYISDLENGVLSSANVVYYAEILKEYYKRRRVIKVSEEMKKSAYENCSVKHIVEKAGDKIFSLHDSKTSMEHVKEVAFKTLTNIEENYMRKGELPGFKTDFSHLDMATGGLQRGNLFVVAARPSMGKTTFGLNLIQSVSKEINTAIFSFEMSGPQLIERMLSSNCMLSMSDIRSGKLQDEDFVALIKGANKLTEKNIMLYDAIALNVGEIKGKCKKLKLDQGLDVVMIDYLQLIQGDEKLSREQQVSKITRELKLMARELNICVIALAQLSRGPESRHNKRPLMSDLRESGAIEQDADIIAFLYRDDYYNRESREKGICDVIISKNRSGKTGVVKLKWQGEYQRFSNYFEKSSR